MANNQQRKEKAQQLLVEKLEKEAKRAKLQKNILIGSSIFVVIALITTGSIIFFKRRSDRIEAAKWTDCAYSESAANGKSVKLPEGRTSNQHQIPIEIRVASGGITKTLKGVLDQTKAPCAVNAVVSLIQQNYYNNTTCHRLLLVEDKKQPDHLIQCGDPTGTGTGNPGFVYAEEYPSINSKAADIKNEYQDLEEKQNAGEIEQKDFTEQSKKLNDEYNAELDKYYTTGTIVMAKSNNPNTTAAQFFIIFGKTVLPPDYTIVGKIDEASVKELAQMTKPGIINPKTAPEKPGYPLINDGKPKVPVKIVEMKVINEQ